MKHKSIPSDCAAPLDAVGFDIIHISSEKNRGHFVAFIKAPTRFLQSVSKFIAALKVYYPSVVLCKKYKNTVRSAFNIQFRMQSFELQRSRQA